MTGGAHPGIDVMVKAAREISEKDVCFVTGGFHLTGASNRDVDKISVRLSELGVKKIAPSHCTGERALREFEKRWGRECSAGSSTLCALRRAVMLQ